MATYREIQEWVRQHHGFVPETCWIAHVKADRGLTKAVAPNRLAAQGRARPCPPAKRAAIESALRRFGLLR